MNRERIQQAKADFRKAAYALLREFDDVPGDDPIICDWYPFDRCFGDVCAEIAGWEGS